MYKPTSLHQIIKKQKGFLRKGRKSPSFFPGSFAIVSKETGYLQPKHLEGVRRVLVQKFKKQSHFIIYPFCTKPVTKKSTGVRMGKGKGAVDE